MKRRQTAWAVAIFILLLTFQNCGQVASFHEIDGTSVNASSLGGPTPTPTATPGLTPTPTPNPSVTPTPTLQPTPTPTPTGSPPPPCDPNSVGAPSMQNSSSSMANVNSGKGPTAGSSMSAALNFKYTSSNAPANCSQNANVQCTLVSNNVVAFDQTGNTSPVTNNMLTCARNPTTLTPNNGFSVNFAATDNDTTTQCLSGSATFNVSLQSSANTTKVSAPQMITVTYHNNCYPENSHHDAPHTYDLMGSAVAIDGNTAAVVAPGDDGASGTTSNIGAIYIYNRSGAGDAWSLAQTLRTTDTGNTSLQGMAGDSPSAIAMKNGIIALGSDQLSNNGAGAVYVFKFSGGTWSAVQKLSGVATGSRFGRAVALDGSHLVVGAPGENGGAVYVYDTGSFAQTAKILTPLAIHDFFGGAVAVENNLLAVGAPGTPGFENQTTGDLLVYQLSGSSWSEITANPLRANSTKQNVAIKDSKGNSGTINFAMAAKLGAAIAISNGVTVIGSPGFMMGGMAPGLALVLSADQKSLQTMTDVSGTDGGLFGFSVGIDGSRIVVGAPKVRNRGGAVDMFSLSGSTFGFTRRVTSLTGADYDQFGYAVGISGTYFVVGIENKSSPNNAEGATSLFSTTIP